MCRGGGQCTGAYSVACNASLLMRLCGCVHAHMCARARVCVLISVPLCFASVQKGLVPTTWCRAASAPPIPAWIATLAANQKLPAAFAVCPLSIFSNTSLNLLASLGCCIKPPPHPPHSNMLPYYKFLMSTFSQLFRSTPPRQWMTNSQQSGDIACQRAAAVLLHLESWKRDFVEDDHRWLASTSSF